MNHMVKKEPRRRGRPRQFDEREALDAALRVFWAKGYDGTTIDDLVAAMGLGRPSLYATFGDKEALFARCLDHYGAVFGSKTLHAFHAAKTVHGAVRAFLRRAVMNATGADGTPPGCLLSCVAPAVADHKVRDAVAAAMAGAATLIAARLRDAVRDTELPASFPIAARSRALVDASNSLTLRARLGVSRAELLVDADQWAALLLSPESERK